MVSYINTSAAVKAESDYCCTSANAAKVVAAIPADRPILFLPDKFLAAVVARQTGRSNIVAYPGYCHVHKTIRPDDVVEIMDEHPDIELLLHPECGCVSSCMAKAADGSLPQDRTFFLSTEGMLRHIGESSANEFAVGTEIGIMHQLGKKFPDEEFPSHQSQCRLRVHEDDHSGQGFAVARNDVAPDHRAVRNREKGSPRDRSDAGARVNASIRLRVGILGVGSIGRTLATALDAKRIDAELVAIADQDIQKSGGCFAPSSRRGRA